MAKIHTHLVSEVLRGEWCEGREKTEQKCFSSKQQDTAHVSRRFKLYFCFFSNTSDGSTACSQTMPIPKHKFTTILFIHVSLHATPASFGLLRIRQSAVEHGAGDSQKVNATWSSVCCPAPVSIAIPYIINTLRGRRIPRTALFNPISTIPHRGSLFEVLTQHSSQIGWNRTLDSTELCHEIVILSDCSCSWLKPKYMATLSDAQQHQNSLNCYHSLTSMVKEGESYQATDQKHPPPPWARIPISSAHETKYSRMSPKVPLVTLVALRTTTVNLWEYWCST